MQVSLSFIVFDFESFMLQLYECLFYYWNFRNIMKISEGYNFKMKNKKLNSMLAVSS